MNKDNQNKSLIVPAINRETFTCLIVISVFIGGLCYVMGVQNTFSTLFNTAHDLILNTIWYLTGVLVLTGALVSLMSEFGIIALLNRIVSPLMKPLYDLPGAAALGIVTTYLGDSPAIISLGSDKGFIKYFSYRQRAVLANLGTTFAMGLVVTTFMLGLSNTPEMTLAILVGNFSTIIASVISVRLMNRSAKKYFGPDGEKLIPVVDEGTSYDIFKERKIREGGMLNRVMGSLLDGGKGGVDLGLAIIPGNIVICTIVMMLVKGPGADGIYTGGAMEGIALLPMIAEKLNFILEPLYGFTSSEAIAFPCTAVGSVGAALGMVPDFLKSGLIGANDIAVFTAMGMSFSGFLSVQVAMMDALKCRELAAKAIALHTFAVLVAGIFAHWAFVFASQLLL